MREPELPSYINAIQHAIGICTSLISQHRISPINNSYVIMVKLSSGSVFQIILDKNTYEARLKTKSKSDQSIVNLTDSNEIQAFFNQFNGLIENADISKRNRTNRGDFLHIVLNDDTDIQPDTIKLPAAVIQAAIQAAAEAQHPAPFTPSTRIESDATPFSVPGLVTKGDE